jgi:hypothetical protein
MKPDNYHLLPVNGKVLLRRVTESSSGLSFETTPANNSVALAEVVSVGKPQKVSRIENGTPVTQWLEPSSVEGDLVYFLYHSDYYVTVEENGEELYLVNSDAVVSILVPGPRGERKDRQHPDHEDLV